MQVTGMLQMLIWFRRTIELLSEEYFLPSYQEMNHITVALYFIEAMQTLWLDGVEFDNLLPVEGASPYMKKPAK
jgi:hypothetical protein